MAYSQEDMANTKAAICERIANGESLRGICEDEAMPNKATVFRWLSEDADFSDQYARARESQADAIFDEILDIADDGRNDWMERNSEDGANIGWRENGEALQRSRLRVDARKWMAGKLRPKKYGDKLEVDQTTTLTASDPFMAMFERIASSGKRLVDSKNVSSNAEVPPPHRNDFASDGENG